MSTTQQNQSKNPPKASPPPSEEAGGYKSWGEVGTKPPKSSNGGSQSSIEHLTLAEGPTYRIRLVGKPYQFWRHYEVLRATSPGFKSDVAWQAGHVPRERYAILILDRNDNNKLKILEAGPAVFNEFKNYFELKQRDPGGKEGPDWMIQVKVPSRTKDGKTIKDKRQTQYKVMADESAPFNAEEQKYIKDNWVELKDVKKPTDPDLIKEMLEDAKTRSDSDPIPGSNDWWNARKEKRRSSESGSSAPSGGSPMASEEPAEQESSQEADSASAGYNALFDDEGSQGSTVRF